MAAKKGREQLLYIGAFGSATKLAGVQVTDMAINNETVDITNKDSSGWQTLLAAAGMQSCQITLNGVFTDDASEETFRGYAFADSINTFTFVFNSDGTTGDTLEASFQISNYTRSGEHNNAEQFSATLASSGTPTYTADQTLSGI